MSVPWAFSMTDCGLAYDLALGSLLATSCPPATGVPPYSPLLDCCGHLGAFDRQLYSELHGREATADDPMCWDNTISEVGQGY